MYFIGIDSGTQSTKAIVIDIERGSIVAEAQEGYELIGGLPPGHMEQDPKVWIGAVDKVVMSCLDQLGESRAKVRGIGVSGQQHGLVALGKNDFPVRPAKLWCDTSTTEQCEAFAKEFAGSAGLIEMAGNAILPGYTAPKILWLKENEPENFEATTTILLPHDYINFWLSGVRRMEYGDASGTGLMDVRKREWCTELIDFIDPKVREMLPSLGSSLEPHGELTPSIRHRWGLTGRVVISAGGGDNMMGAIGTGNVRDGVLTASLGTSGTLYGSWGEPVIDGLGEVAAFCDSADRWFPLLCTMNVTVVTEKVRAMFGWDHAQLEAAVASVPAGADGLIFLPYLTGERTPNLPKGTGVLHGMRPENMSPAHVARAAMEGATLGLGYGMKRLRELGMDPSEVRLTGGGSNSAVWRQMCADAFGASTVTLKTSEGAALGAAIQAVYTFFKSEGSPMGYEELATALVDLDEESRCQPDDDTAAKYAEQIDRQIELTRAMNQANFL
ncbi:MAG: xylulokinase [Verrucomicrobiota bacterium]